MVRAIKVINEAAFLDPTEVNLHLTLKVATYKVLVGLQSRTHRTDRFEMHWNNFFCMEYLLSNPF